MEIDCRKHAITFNITLKQNRIRHMSCSHYFHFWSEISHVMTHFAHNIPHEIYLRAVLVIVPCDEHIK